MPLGTTSTGFKAAVEGLGYGRAEKLTVTVPVVGALDLSGNALSRSGPEVQDTTSYPDDLTNKSGLTNSGGTITLAGEVLVSGSLMPVTRLLNANDSRSPLYRLDTDNAALTLSLGAWTTNGGVTAPEYVDFTGYVTSIVPRVAAGTVDLEWSDMPPGWDDAPAMNEVLIQEPYNAGLTSEFAIDRIARACSGGAVASWPAQRPQCVLAVGLRSSIWPEVGSLNSSADEPTFTRGTFGTGLTNPESMTWQLASDPPLGPINLEILRWSANADTSVLSLAATTWALIATRAGADLTLQVGGSGSHTFAGIFNTIGASQYLLIAATVGTASTNVTVTVDATTYTATITGDPTITPQPDPVLAVASLYGVIEGLQVTTEGSPASNYAFTPGAVLDPSLNPLQAIPAIDAGSDAYAELQTIAEAEGGWIGFRSGVLTFLNRVTIAGQLPSRAVTAKTSFKSLESATSGAFQTYDQIDIDYTEYQWAKRAVVFQPGAVWEVAARSTQTWTRTLPNGVTVGALDETIDYLTTDSATPGATNSRLRASLDRYGATEVPDTSQVYGTVRAVTTSQIEITVTNGLSVPVFLASPSNYASPPDVPAGTPAVWVNGIAVTPDQPTTLHVYNPLAATPESVYTVPSNPYRQDRDAATAYGWSLLDQLGSPKLLYGSVSIVPDPRVTIPDRITLDVPIEGGGVTTLDVLVWGVSQSASYEQGQVSEEMTLDVRAVAAPGEAVLDESILDDTTFLYGALA